MKVLLYIVILALLLLAPVERLDIARLEPVQTVAVHLEAEQVVLDTDTGNRGRGQDLAAAIEDLEENTPGVIYLDTAQYLLLTEEAAQYAAQLAYYLHPGAKVSLWDGKGSVKDAAKFLAVRHDLPSVKTMKKSRWQAVEKS